MSQHNTQRKETGELEENDYITPIMIKILEDYLGIISADTLKRLKHLLKAAAENDGTDKSSIQQFDDKENVLHLVGYLGFSNEFGTYFKKVRPFDGCSCGRAIGLAGTVMVGDVRKDVAYTPHMDTVNTEGFRAVKSIPIIGKNKEKLGVISTHFTEPKLTWQSQTLDDIVQELAVIFSSLPLPITAA